METKKNLNSHVLLCCLWVLLLVVAGCAPSTQITGTWKSPEATQTYNNIVVGALTDNILARQKVETDMQTQLQQRGIKATRSIDIFPPSGASKNGPDVNLLLEKMRGDDYDAVLTVALVDEQTQTRYVPGNVGYRPITRYAWYGNFRGYYTYWYPILYDPGYYTEDKIYFVETNLYNVADDNLLWSAQSQSYSPSSLRKAAEKLAEITVNQMAKEGLIQGQVSQP
ncbi:hypothetical protein H7F15_16920 [Pontibacter sp. Tf4]|uniref:hypothetical protein n=1 Tax=Pontibacter sp. Tf4 TaxID=2761620 RepID=UPI00162445CD|nr:hypothetical protein [Pontibacter sp. Tf4]MBB6612727.1 hypothetical protein [Pontibacter sp. Tf4]